MKDIVLASASPRRKELLTQIGLTFRVVASVAEENLDALSGSPAEKAEKLALLKAREVAARLSKEVVVGADTIVVLGERIFGKPKNEAEAMDMLHTLSGREHCVITGVAVVDAESGVSKVSHEVTKVRFAALSEEKIRAYIHKGSCYDKAGAYGIQDWGALLVERIEGCYFNVVGMPLMRLSRMMEEFGIRVL